MKRVSIGLCVVLVVSVALIAACGDDDSDDDATPASTEVEASATEVDATLAEWSITIDPASAKAGEIRFVAENTGSVLHELVIAKTDLGAADLPTYGPSDTPEEGHAVGDVNEDEIESAGEVEDVDPGATKDATFRLEPGHYVLFCNLPAHYSQGMRVEFTVE